MKIIDKINNVLLEQGISQTAIAKKAGIEQRTVNRVLSGKTKKPDMAIVIALCKELGLTYDPVSEVIQHIQDNPNPGKQSVKRLYIEEILNELGEDELDRAIFILLQERKAKRGV